MNFIVNIFYKKLKLKILIMNKFKATLNILNKVLCDLFFCYAITYLFLSVCPVNMTMLVCFFIVIILYFSVSFLFFKGTVFNPKQKLAKKYLFSIFLFILFILIVLNIATPVSFISLPTTYHYANEINRHKKNPHEYIDQLFDKYDIVILSERLHPEYTQRDFFSEIILNDKFAQKIKNVYTEFGNINNQAILDTFLVTKFDTKEDLQKTEASIVRENGGSWPMWNNTNIFDFLIKLHSFNENKTLQNKVNLHFADLEIDWNTLQNHNQLDSIRMLNRDSIMAYNIINQYVKDSAEFKKMLIIMNTRHAWKQYSFCTADYILKMFPNTTATVLINGSTQEEKIRPMLSGLLDEAAKKISDFNWAIDFSECSLGNLKFDLFPYNKEMKYKDVFNGMIYYLHPNDWIISHGYPYCLHNYKDTLFRRSAVIGEEYLDLIKRLENEGYYSEIKQSNNVFDIAFFNFNFFIINTFILMFLLVNLLVLLCKNTKKEDENKIIV